MGHYLAVIYEEPERAIGVMVPDLPGCFSAGDTMEEALINAREIIEVFLEMMVERGQPIPSPRSYLELSNDPEFAERIRENQIALVQFQMPKLPIAAE